MDKKVVTRFAPSPTGFQHIGGLRSALFNWLLAKKFAGDFILRLEDTDQSRLVEGAYEQLATSLDWLGTVPDYSPNSVASEQGIQGPFVQSQRLEIYKKHIDILLENDLVYRDWTSSDDIAAMRKSAQEQKKPFIFKRSMALTEGDIDTPHVIRFAVPDDQTVSWDDAVKGKQSWRTKDIDDFIAIKGDGYPTYHFANVVDDHLMDISHAIRADEWLSSTPKHVLLYQAFGWEHPIYVHVAPVLGPNGSKKLSKRDGAKSTDEYKAEGYLPSALINYLALLGWNPKTEQEIFTTDELIEKFSLDGLQSSGAKFDQDRLDWMNGKHIRLLETQRLDEQCVEGSFWSPEAQAADPSYRQSALALVKERLKKLSELDEYTSFFFKTPIKPSYEVIAKETKYDQQTADELVIDTISLLEESDFTNQDLEDKLYNFAKTKDLKVGKYFMLVRLMVTGSKIAPGLFETLNVIGKTETLQRLKS